jgi:hypothetical protein
MSSPQNAETAWMGRQEGNQRDVADDVGGQKEVESPATEAPRERPYAPTIA